MSNSRDSTVRQEPAVVATGASKNTLLSTQQLTKNFGGLTAVDQVDFSITAGEIRCLIGPNGAGKSTFLQLITGQLSPSAGKIYFDGHDLTEMDIPERIDTGLSVKFQSPHIYESLSVAQNIEVPLRRLGEDANTTLTGALNRIELADYREKRASDLSHGQKQRLEIGMAMTINPTLMLLDEPVAGMSVDEAADIAELIRSLQEDGMTFLVVEHDMEFVRKISEQVTVLNQGSILRQGPLETIEADDTVRRIYLGEDV